MSLALLTFFLCVDCTVQRKECFSYVMCMQYNLNAESHDPPDVIHDHFISRRECKNIKLRCMNKHADKILRVFVRGSCMQNYMAVQSVIKSESLGVFEYRSVKIITNIIIILLIISKGCGNQDAVEIRGRGDMFNILEMASLINHEDMCISFIKDFLFARNR